MKKSALNILLLLVPTLASAMEKSKELTPHDWWKHPKASEITPSTLLKLAALPEEYREPVESFVDSHLPLLSQLTTMPKKLSELTREHVEANMGVNKERIKKAGFTDLSRGSHVFEIPGGLIVKIGGMGNKYALLRASVDSKQLTSEGKDSLPSIKTYQTASRALTAQLIGLTSVHSSIITPRSYVFPLQAEVTEVDDRSVICIEEKIKELDLAKQLRPNPKTEKDRLRNASLIERVSLKTFREFLEICRETGLWSTDNNIWITEDGRIIYPDLEQPNNTKGWLLDDMPKFRANGQVGVRHLVQAVYNAGDLDKLKAGFDAAIAIAYDHLEQLNKASGEELMSTCMLDNYKSAADKIYQAKNCHSDLSKALRFTQDWAHVNHQRHIDQINKEGDAGKKARYEKLYTTFRSEINEALATEKLPTLKLKLIKTLYELMYENECDPYFRAVRSLIPHS